MQNLNHSTKDLSEAIQIFLRELPDPLTSAESTIVGEFLVEDKRVLLQAQKSKGMDGMIWNVDVRNFKN